MNELGSKLEHHDVIIVGGGLAGLSCGAMLGKSGRQVTLLEATDRVGGRVRTDVVDGFTLDHGFQVLLTAYPACKELLDYDALRLRRFDRGALIRQNGRFRMLGDPFRHPSQAFATALNPVGTLGDKLRIAKLRGHCRRGTLQEIYDRRPMSTLDYLRNAGFSNGMIDHFFRRFLGGVYLDETLAVSSRMLEFVFRMFDEGDIAIPAEGMAAIPRQLAESLPRGALRLRASVASLRDQTVELTDGTVLRANHVVVATESNGAARLLGIQALETEWNGTTTIYFAAPEPPEGRKLLMLAGDESGPVQTATVLSNIASEYSTGSEALVSVSLRQLEQSRRTEDLDAVDQSVRGQLRGWFGKAVADWRRLGVYQVPYGLPRQSLDPVVRPIRATDRGGPAHTFLCGDYCETPSIQGAMNSGIRAADAILDRG